MQPHEVLQPQSVWQSQGLQGLQELQELHGLQQPQLLPQPVLQSTIRQPRATGALTCRQTLGIPPFWLAPFWSLQNTLTLPSLPYRIILRVKVVTPLMVTQDIPGIWASKVAWKKKVMSTV